MVRKERPFTPEEERKITAVKLFFRLAVEIGYAPSLSEVIEKFIEWLEGPISQEKAYQKPENTMYLFVTDQLSGLYYDRSDELTGYTKHEYIIWYLNSIFRYLAADEQ